VLVVEHDLAILDLLADNLHVAYGRPGAFGVVTSPKSTKNGINEYLGGYLENENMRIRQESIIFEEHAPRTGSTGDVVVEYPDLTKSYGDGEFSLSVEGGTIRENEVLGVVGPNGCNSNRCSTRTSPTSPAVSASGSPSRPASPRTPICTCWTNPPHTWTSNSACWRPAPSVATRRTTTPPRWSSTTTST